MEYKGFFERIFRAIVSPKVLTRKGIYEFLSVAPIFILVLLSIKMRMFISAENPAVFESYGDYYLVYYFPKYVYEMLFVVASYFFLRAWIVKSCLYTKIISTAYFLGKALSLSQVLFSFSWETYIVFWDFVMYVGVILTGSIWLIKIIYEYINEKLKKYDRT